MTGLLVRDFQYVSYVYYTMFSKGNELNFGNDGRIVTCGTEGTAEDIGEAFSTHDGRLINLKQTHVSKLLQLAGQPIARGGFGHVYVSTYSVIYLEWA